MFSKWVDLAYDSLIRKKSTYQVFKYFHILDCKQSFIGIKFDVLMKCEFFVKDKSQIFLSLE